MAAQPPDRSGKGVHGERSQPRWRADFDRAVVSNRATGCPANPLFGLAEGNPVSAEAAYNGSFDQFGTPTDPMVGRRVGGTITFGGGLGLYSGTSAVGGLGLSGDTACADHSTAWRVRIDLGLAPTAGEDLITLNNATGHPHGPNDGGTQGTN